KKAQRKELKDVTRDGSNKAEKLFALDKPQEKAFYQESNNGFIVELSDVAQSKLPELSNVKDKVKNDIYQEKAVKSLNADLEKAQEDVFLLQILLQID
ncbi:MAG TPA: hypothetical protein PKX55_23315, partial [Leptospiraceae bacterium]|nr:hypothetical protein [Leptospiraceae bacterium]